MKQNITMDGIGFTVRTEYSYFVRPIPERPDIVIDMQQAIPAMNVLLHQGYITPRTLGDNLKAWCLHAGLASGNDWQLTCYGENAERMKRTVQWLERKCNALRSAAEKTIDISALS